MKTIEIGPLFFLLIRIRPGSPLFHVADVHEVDDRCRTAVGRFVRLWPLPWCIGVGRWRETGNTEQEQFDQIFHARPLSIYTEDGTVDPRYEQVIRGLVATHAHDPDDEWTILQAVGLEP